MGKSTAIRSALTMGSVRGGRKDLKMRGRGVVFTGRERAEIEEITIDPDDLQPGEALVRGQYSIISAGTEGASYTGLTLEAPPVYRPRVVRDASRPGYGH